MPEAQTFELFRDLGTLIAKYAFELIGAVIILILGWLLARWGERGTTRALERFPRIDPTLKPLLASLVRYAILIFVAIAALAQFGIQVASIIAVLGAAGVAIALALQGTLSNVAAGVMLLVLRPFRIGEYIDAGPISGMAVAGKVEAIGLFTTELKTADGLYVMTPNSQLWNRPIKNFSRMPTRRLDLVIGVSGGDNLDKTISVVNDLMKRDPRVLKEPAPEVTLTALTDSTVDITLRCWTMRDNYWPLLYDMTKQVKQRLESEGITADPAQGGIRRIQRGPQDYAA